ncbi:MAG: hypothetical protein KY475_04235 [Planctomycetes bacterium]|nr:hypothetical protein [Planctomycetota bacterium]
MPRYVVLHHQTPPEFGRPTHWDLMLESGGVLRTWALAEAPQPGKVVEAMRLPDHRLDYLEYEGPVSGNRGVVSRWDAGEYQIARETADEFVIVLSGRRLQGEAVLRRCEPRDEEHQRWMFCLSTSAEACWNEGGDVSSESSVRPAR